ncbi:hypothetical protein CPB85DRAFT_1437503 [Mucidula mucida]|nr:hypothetical protein CPB85DRAFT_1437503 [Mucidula mucida]
MATFFLGMRLTRSNHIFLPWVLPVQVDADFAALLQASTSAELDDSLDEDNSRDEDEEETDADDINRMPLVSFTCNAEPIIGVKRLRPSPSSGKNLFRHAKHQRKCDTVKDKEGHHADDRLNAKIFERAEKLATTATAADFPAAKNMYTAKRETQTLGVRTQYTPEQLDAMGLRKVEYKPG